MSSLIFDYNIIQHAWRYRLENPPLWVWAIIVGAIIASKFVYRWQITKQIAKEDQGRRRNINSDQKKGLGNNDLYDNINRRYQSNIRAHKYSPSRFYKDYFAIKHIKVCKMLIKFRYHCIK